MIKRQISSFLKAFNHEKINEVSIFYFSHELTITGSSCCNVFVIHDIFLWQVFLCKTFFVKRKVIKYVHTIFMDTLLYFWITIFFAVIELMHPLSASINYIGITLKKTISINNTAFYVKSISISINMFWFSCFEIFTIYLKVRRHDFYLSLSH